ncbi:MAG TPA: acetolactate synthase small subunit [Armatimonadota bacterium]|jgi:acetolactate synthase-1/3 small subunit
MQHTITILVENKPGVLARVAGLFARRGYNIASLAVSITNDPTVSRITLVAEGDEDTLAQIVKQTDKLIDVVRVADYTSTAVLQRELALYKVSAPLENRPAIMQIADVFRGNVVDMSPEDTFTIEVTGEPEKIDAMERLLAPYGIKETVRTGAIVMARGATTAYGEGASSTSGQATL